MVYLACDTYQKKMHPLQLDRETFLTEDGGTVGIDWTCDIGSKSGRPTSQDKNKPILILAPGLGGSSMNFYITALNKAA